MPLKQILRMEPQKAPNRKDDDQTVKTATQQPQQAVAPHRKGPNFAKKKDKFSRKRSQSFSGVNSKFCPPYKYRTRPMLPTKFLLGGNICDPLNLNSLQDEEVNRTVNAITPKSSPIPTPPQRRGHIEVIIPPNIHDPLNLIDCADDAEYEQQLTSPLKKGSKRRKKKKRTSSATTEPSDADISASEAQTPDLSNDSAKIPDLEPPSSGVEDASPKEKLPRVTRDLKLELTPVKEKKHKPEGMKKLRRLDSMDKIVSPVVPQPGAWLKRALQFNRNAGPSGRGLHNRPSTVKTKENGGRTEKQPHFRDKNKAYQYGNYNRYYGYRNPNHEVDSRLRCFAAHRHIFEGRDILDIGCNIGHITLSIARDFGAKSVVGIDIDKKLIGIARKNVRHYVNCNDSPRDEPPDCSPRLDKSDKCFPISMPILYGPVDVPGMQNDEVRGRGFPHNVTFVQGNYVLDDDSLLCTEQPQFDVILCLSITKWLHLNWGDAGLKQAFRRMYAQLKPGGKLILEPQSWASYKHKKTLTETIYKNYNSIEFFPEKFTQYLLSSEVGFAKSEIMGQPHHPAKGFQRPIQVFTRSNLSPSQSQRSYSITPSHTATSGSLGGACGRGGVAGKQVYTCLPSPDELTSAKVEVETRGEAVVVVREHSEPLCAGTDDRGAGGECVDGRSSDKGSSGGKSTRDTQDMDRLVVDTLGNTTSAVCGGQERVKELSAKCSPETAGEMADERGTGDNVTDKQEQSYSITDKREKVSQITDKQAQCDNITDNTEQSDKIAVKQEHASKIIENKATITENPATITDNQAKMTDNRAKLNKQARITEKQAKITDNRARITDNQARITDNLAKITDNQTRIDSLAMIIDNRARIDKQTKITDKQTRITDNQARITDNLAKITDNQARIDSLARITVKRAAKSTCNPAPGARKPDNQVASDTASPAADNQEPRTEKPLNQDAGNNKCNEITEFPDTNPPNAIINVDGHLGLVTAGTTTTTTSSNKRKHSTPANPDDEAGTPAKRKYTSPVKRKTNAHNATIAVKRMYNDDEDDITYAKRRKNQRRGTTDSTAVSEVDSSLTGRGVREEIDDGTRLDNRETVTTEYERSTSGKSTHTSPQYRRLHQTPKCSIMDNT